jgi:hypothetical protein
MNKYDIQKSRVVVEANAPTSHLTLTDVNDAGVGESSGHITDGSQTIAGDKTFSGDTIFQQIDFTSFAGDTSRTIYLSPTGNDSTGNGSSGSPFFSIHRAIEDIKPRIDDSTLRIKLADGDYDYSALGDLVIEKYLH